MVLIGLVVSNNTYYHRNMTKRENLFSADNQQERSRREFFRGYVVGLVDGEGSFHIAFQKREDLPLGISIIPEFHVSQNRCSLQALRLVQRILGCGYIKPNHRNSSDTTYVLVVRDRKDLLTKIIPFFKYNQLVTSKCRDFEIFAKVVDLIEKGEHRNPKTIIKIIDLAYKMNSAGKRRTIKKEELINRVLKSSETIWKNHKKL